MSTQQTHREKSLGTISSASVPVEQLPVVELDEDQLRRAAALAYERNHSYRRINGGDVFSSDSMMSHLIGIVCEMAVAEAYSTDIDTKTYRFGDDGLDLELWNHSIDVKGTATDMRRPELLIKSYKNLDADYYLLTHIIEWGEDFVRIRIHGYADSDTVADREPEEHPGSDENYVVGPDELVLPPWVQSD